MSSTVVRLTLAALLLVSCSRSKPTPKPDLSAPGSWGACAECPVVHPVPPGSFNLGTPNATDASQGSPTRQIQVPSFATSTEITRAQFAHFVQEADYHPSAGCLIAKPTFLRTEITWSATATWNQPELPGTLQESDAPVTCVSWTDARAYVSWLSASSGAPFRLLSESEWEYLARAGTTGSYYWPSADATAFCDEANTFIGVPLVRPNPCRDQYPATSPVGRMGINPFQASDMLGNVEEWVEDCFAPTYDLIPTDGKPYELPITARLGEPVRWCRDRVVRGGSWKDRITTIGIPIRHHATRTERTNFRGFRIAVDCNDLNICTDRAGTPWPR